MGYYYETPAGKAEISFVADRWVFRFNGRSVAKYHSPEDAATDMAKARIDDGNTEIDLSNLHIPDDLSDWHRRRN